jgi:uncharacterized protein (TIGR02246 family)
MTTAQSHADITYLNHRYADAVCRRDAEQWAGTWAEDAVWELGKGRRVEGRDAIVEMWNGAMDRFCAVVQNVVNAAFDINDQAGSATGRSYIMEHWHRGNGDKGILLAYYDDTYTRTDGG